MSIIKVLRSQRGATMLEYAFIGIIILVAGVLGFGSMSESVKSKSGQIFNNFKNANA